VQTLAVWHWPSTPQVLPALQEAALHLQSVATQSGISPTQGGWQPTSTQTLLTHFRPAAQEFALHRQVKVARSQSGTSPEHGGVH